MEKKNDYYFELSPLSAENISSIIDYISNKLMNKKAANDIIELLYDKIKKLHIFHIHILYKKIVYLKMSKTLERQM